MEPKRDLILPCIGIRGKIKLNYPEFSDQEHKCNVHIYKEDINQRLARGINLSTQKMGIHEWSYSNDYDPSARRLMPHVDLKERFKKLDIEVELGFTVDQTIKEVERCLNCDIQTVFDASYV